MPVTESSVAWNNSLRRVASVLIVLHLSAIFSAPWSEPPPSSELSRRVAGVFRPYLKFVSVDNGYRFFAPDPGPSHLIRYEVTTADGQLVRGQFPQRGEHFPRLHFHRHFMLSEMIFTLTAPLMDLPPTHLLTDDERYEIRTQQTLVESLHRSVASYLLRQYAGTRVRLYAVAHGLASEADVVRGRELNDASLFQEFYIGEFSLDPH